MASSSRPRRPHVGGKHEFESRCHAKNTKLLITIIMKTFSKLEIDDKIYYITPSGDITIHSVFAKVDSKIMFRNGNKIYFLPHVTICYIDDICIFADKKEAQKYLYKLRENANKTLNNISISLLLLWKHLVNFKKMIKYIL